MLGGILVLVVVYGIVGYLLLGFRLGDAVYMTILALTTLGFGGEVTLGMGAKLFTASVAVLGVSAFFVGVTVLATAVVEGRIRLGSWRRRMERSIAALKDHYVICAYGRVGRAVGKEFTAQGIPFVTIDIKQALVEQMRRDGVLYLIGDPESEEVLHLARVDRARGLVCAVDSDATNVYITLVARSLNPKLFIVARAGEPESYERLLRAGADRVVSPYVMSGRHMSLMALQPDIVDHLDLVSRGHWRSRLDEMVVDEAAARRGHTVGDMCEGAIPVLLIRSERQPIPNPSRDEAVGIGDAIVLYRESGADRR